MADEQAVEDEVVDRWIALVDKSEAGDREALNELLTEIRPYVKLIAQITLGRQSQGAWDASDVAQDCMVKILQGMENLDADSDRQFRAWLRTIARNGTLDALRRSRRRQGREVPLPEDLRGNVPLASDISTPSQHVARQEEGSKWQAAYDQLSEDDRTIVRLRCEERLSHEDIAERLGTSQVAVRKRLERALKRLEKAARAKK